MTKDQKIQSLEKEIDLKNQEIESLKNRLNLLEEQIINKNRKLFGKSSEKVDSNQLNFFNEAEAHSSNKFEEPTIEEISYKRNKPSKNKTMKDNFSDLEIVEIDHKLPESTKCDICDSDMVVIGKKQKDILKLIPAKMYIERHNVYTYGCPKCKEETDESNIITADAPHNLISKSVASNELLAHIIIQKYAYAIPLYRQEAYFKNLGVVLSRQTMSNWVISCSNKLEILYEYLRKNLLKEDYIQADETTLKVLKLDGNETRSNTYMWLYKNCNSQTPIILYDYQKTRSSSCPKKFLDGFIGYLQSDGYAAYNSIENVKNISCMAHIRRPFYEARELLSENKEKVDNIKETTTFIGFNYCEKIYSIENEIKKNYKDKENFYEKRLEIRKEELRPLLIEFEAFINREVENVLPKSKIGKALEYAKKNIHKLFDVCENGRIEIDNNAAERAIKPFVIGRKNWLFSKTPKGAKASAVIYSIIETSKANGLFAERYLNYLFDKFTGIDDFSNFDMEELLPWALSIPDDIKMNKEKNQTSK